MGKYPQGSPPVGWRLQNPALQLRISSDPTYKDRFDEKYWPKGGFIDDLVCHTYGFETTNLFAVWTAIAGLAGLVQRDAWLNSGKGLFANFYTILVAEPAVAHKSTAMNLFGDIEALMFKLMTNLDLKTRKKRKKVHGKATAEAIFDAMKNEAYVNIEKEAVETDAVFIATISELTTFLSKATYNASLVDKITDFYDCKSFDTDFTRGGGADGQREIRNIFATLFGCTTPDHLASSIPAEAFGGGFMSRCMIVRQDVDDIKRSIPEPYFPYDCPDANEMAERLLWVVGAKQGEFKMTPDAREAYYEWYHIETAKMRNKVKAGQSDHRDSRKTLQIQKLSLMMALQRYDLSREIRLEDFQCAVKLYEYTTNEGTQLINDIYYKGIEDGQYSRLRDIIQRGGEDGVYRRILSTNHRFKKADLDKYLTDLLEDGAVKVEKRDLTLEVKGVMKTIKSDKWFWIDQGVMVKDE